MNQDKHATVFKSTLFGGGERNVQFLDSSKFIAAFTPAATNTDSHTQTFVPTCSVCDPDI